MSLLSTIVVKANRNKKKVEENIIASESVYARNKKGQNVLEKAKDITFTKYCCDQSDILPIQKENVD